MQSERIIELVDEWTGYQVENVEIYDTGQHNITFNAKLDTQGVYIKIGKVEPITIEMKNRFNQSVEALTYLTRTSLRVPKLIFSDLNKFEYNNKMYYGILILEEIEGKPLDLLWDDIQDDRELIVDKYARALQQIHNIPVSGFGKFSQNGYKWWNEWFISQLSYHRHIVKNSQLIDNEIIDNLYDQILDNPFLWNYNGEPKLVHNDLWRGNIIIDENYSMGIVDWEFSIGADPVFDLQWIESDIFRDEEKLIDRFYNQYGIIDLTQLKGKQICYSVYQILRKGTEIIKYDFPDDIGQVQHFLKECSTIIHNYLN